LYVLGKRDDGYHDLATLFQLLDFGDELSFVINDSGALSRTYDLGFSEEVDLCLRAARLLQKESGTHLGAEISLVKRLPTGGGLGGGSSDAATVLLALNYLWGIGYTASELAELGLSLGADVPVFVMGQSAWGEGVGERLTPVSLAHQKWLVVTPDLHVSTANIFSQISLTASPQMKKIRALKMALADQSFDFVAMENQLEPTVRAGYSEVEALFEWFESHAESGLAGPARLSGSGGSVYAPLTDGSDEAFKPLPDNASGFIATGINTHPLHMNFKR